MYLNYGLTEDVTLHAIQITFSILVKGTVHNLEGNVYSHPSKYETRPIETRPWS